MAESVIQALPTFSISTPSPDPPPDPGAPLRQASFTLNQERQTNKLVNDATISDCEFCPNNSNSNVNIKCSAGFYKAVAMPSFSTLSPGFSHHSGTAAVSCSTIEPSLDNNGVEFNRIFWFTIRDNAGVSAAVTVHLHHSTRLVQVQGAAILHDGTVAALWFVKNLLLGLFLKLGKARGHDISNFNQAVLQNNFKNPGNGSISDPNCNFCSKPLKKPAKPVKCFSCKEIFHTSCHKQHSCNGTPNRPRIVSRMKRKASTLETSIFEIVDDSPAPLALPTPSLASSLAPPSISTSMATSSTVSFSSPPSLSLSTTHSITNPILSFGNPPPTRLQAFANLTVSTLPTPSTSAITPSSTSASQPPSPISIPPIFLHSTAAPPVPTNTTRSLPPPSKRSKKSPAAPALTEQEAAKEYLKIQLNLAHTKITTQDAKLVRQSETISILSDRLRLLELGVNSNLMSQYFPAQHSQPNECPQTAGTPPAPPPSQPGTQPGTQSGAQPPGIQPGTQPGTQPSIGLPPPPVPTSSPPPTTGPTGSPSAPPSATPRPSVPLPSIPAQSSLPSSPSPSTCTQCSNISRQMEIVLTEFGLLKQQTNAVHVDITSIKSILQQSSSYQNTSPPSFPQQPAPPLPPPSQEAPPARPQQSSTSRHTQTRPSPPPGPRQPPSQTTQSRPIPPLFPKCPWQSGVYPSGPVRHLPPPRPRSAPGTAPPPPPPPRPSGPPRRRPTQAAAPRLQPMHSSNLPTSPLIVEILDEDDDESPSVPTDEPRDPADADSLNF